MPCAIDIPWTPRTIRKQRTPGNRSTPSFNDLSGILLASLAPFPEARKAVAAALLVYERRSSDSSG
jgi:hypothetical protein